MISVNLSATHFDMDTATGFALGIFNNSTGDFISTAGTGRFDSWGTSGGVEAWLPADATHYFIGEVEGAWVNDNQTLELTTDENFSILPINGGNPRNFPKAIAGVAINPVELSSSGEFYRVSTLVGIGSDLTSETKFGVGAYIGYSELQVDALYSTALFPVPLNSLDQTVKTSSTGLVLLGESRHQLMPSVGVFFKGRAAALYADGRLDAAQGAFGEAAPLLAGDSQSAFAGLLEGEIGFDVAFGPKATISIVGGAAWRNDVFEIVNPLSGTDNTNLGPYVAAHLEQTDLIEYSVGGELAVNF